MQDCNNTMIHLSKEFKDCQKSLIAIGDETRQQIIIALLENGIHGSRVGEITKSTHLSRSAVSHHLQVLKNADIIGLRREGTKNYYFMKATDTQWKHLLTLAAHITGLLEEMSEEEKIFYNRVEEDI